MPISYTNISYIVGHNIFFEVHTNSHYNSLSLKRVCVCVCEIYLFIIVCETFYVR